jgi:hypothetical protein
MAITSGPPRTESESEEIGVLASVYTLQEILRCALGLRAHNLKRIYV